MAKTFHTPLKSNFDLVRNAGAMGDKHPYGRKEILAKYSAIRKREEILDKAWAKISTPNVRLAIAKRVKKADGGGFHVIGMGKVKAANFAELKKKVKASRRSVAFTHVRFGAILAAL